MAQDRTRKIRMHYQMSGSRHDGRPWPPPEQPFDVPEWEARDLIIGGNATPHGKDSADWWKDHTEAADNTHGTKLNRPDPRPDSQIEAEDASPADQAEADAEAPDGAEGDEPASGRPGRQADPELREMAGDATERRAGTTGEDAADSDPDAGNSGPAGSDDPPAPSAVKQAWIDYAVRVRQADPQKAAAMSKADLMSAYGGRL